MKERGEERQDRNVFVSRDACESHKIGHDKIIIQIRIYPPDSLPLWDFPMLSWAVMHKTHLRTAFQQE